MGRARSDTCRSSSPSSNVTPAAGRLGTVTTAANLIARGRFAYSFPELNHILTPLFSPAEDRLAVFLRLPDDQQAAAWEGLGPRRWLRASGRFCRPPSCRWRCSVGTGSVRIRPAAHGNTCDRLLGRQSESPSPRGLEWARSGFARPHGSP